MPYTQVQFIGYEIYTGPSHQDPKRPYYVGLNVDTDDIATRVELMKEALTAAKASDAISKDPSVLKIFMAPEFYFRGARGAYPMELVTGTNNNPNGLIQQLTALIKGSDWCDWLVVFGTYLVTGVSDLGGTEIHNVSLVQKGGYATEEERLSKCVIVEKEFMSGIDFLRLPPQGLSRKGGLSSRSRRTRLIRRRTEQPRTESWRWIQWRFDLHDRQHHLRPRSVSGPCKTAPHPRLALHRRTFHLNPAHSIGRNVHRHLRCGHSGRRSRLQCRRTERGPEQRRMGTP